MSRLESGILQLKQDWCDTTELINGVIQKALPLNIHHTFEFNPNDHIPYFKLDTGLVKEIMRNLLYNALLYTPENSIIHIETVHEGTNCVIIVSDNGTGFPVHEIPYVFNKFYRLPSSKISGSGLGLSIVKGFVEAHNGTIHLENNPSGGARFTIVIPTETSYLKNLKNE